jgi:acetoin utilization deacetylase AcuC-like enzyme
MHKTGIVYHPDYLKHLKLQKIEPVHSALEWVEKVHSKQYIQQIQQSAGQKKPVLLDADTVVGPGSYQVSMLVVSGVLAACDAVMTGKTRNAFCAVRPPGHHAERDRAMGFCLFNNVAIAARYLQENHKLKRILIVDWDVHHGNGTQNCFYQDDTVYYFSIHQYPHYPGTGREEEEGEGPGKGFTLNVPMCAGSGDLEYKEVFETILFPEVARFKPDFVLISAGFDGHRDDELSDLRLTEKGFENMTEVVMDLAQDCCQGRIVSVLEGGYKLASLSSCVKTHLQSLHQYQPKRIK